MVLMAGGAEYTMGVTTGVTPGTNEITIVCQILLALPLCIIIAVLTLIWEEKS